MYKFQPIYKTTVWGGARIASFKGVETALTHVGESWELSGVEGSESVVAEGPFQGLSLAALIEQQGAALVGQKNLARFGTEFPLLIKFIDAHDDLSIQVHPDDTLAMARHGKHGKTEMWYILDAEPQASLIAGFNTSINSAQYEQLVAEDRLVEVLARLSVKAGDCFFLPAGRVHAIGAGTLLAEIQQTSDVTYRIYDYGRMGLDGKPRELHTEEAREAIDYCLYDDYRTHYTATPDKGVELVQCEHFTTELYELSRPHTVDLSARDSFTAVICLAGEGSLTTDDGATLPIRQGETVLVAARHQHLVMTPDASMRLLTTHL